MNRTPLVLAISFPLLGRIRDFHSLERAPAGRTAKKSASRIGRTLVDSVLQALDGSGNPTASGDEILCAFAVDGHDRGAAQQAAHFHPIAHHLAGGRDNAHSGGLLVDDTNGRLICVLYVRTNEAENRIIISELQDAGWDAVADEQRRRLGNDWGALYK